jgi:hypothetical protein
MVVLVAALFTVAWVGLVAFLVCMLWLAIRWRAERSQQQSEAGYSLLLIYAWPAVVLKGSTWSRRSEQFVALLGRASGIVAFSALGVLALVAVFVQFRQS